MPLVHLIYYYKDTSVILYTRIYTLYVYAIHYLPRCIDILYIECRRHSTNHEETADYRSLGVYIHRHILLHVRYIYIYIRNVRLKDTISSIESH